MSEESKVIDTQEAFDSAIKSRLERNTKTVTEEVTKKFEGYLSPEDFSKKTEKGYSEGRRRRNGIRKMNISIRWTCIRLEIFYKNFIDYLLYY